MSNIFKKKSSEKTVLVKPVAPAKAAKIKAPKPVAVVPETPAAPIVSPVTSGLFAGLVPARMIRAKKPRAARTGSKKSKYEQFKGDIETARAAVPPFSYQEIAAILNKSLAEKGEKEFVKVPALVQFTRANFPNLVKTRAAKVPVEAPPAGEPVAA